MSQNTMQQKKEWAIDTCNKVDGSQDNHAGRIWAHLKKYKRNPSGDERVVHNHYNIGYANLCNVMEIHRNTNTKK